MTNSHETKLEVNKEVKKSVINNKFVVTEKAPILSLVRKKDQDHAALYLETFENETYSIQRMDLTFNSDKTKNPYGKATIRCDILEFVSKEQLKKEREERIKAKIAELEEFEEEKKAKNEPFYGADLLKKLKQKEGLTEEDLIWPDQLYEGVCENSHCITWQITPLKANELIANCKLDIKPSKQSKTDTSDVKLPNSDITYILIGDTPVRQIFEKFFASPVGILTSTICSSPLSIDEYFNNQKDYDNCLSWALKKVQLLGLTTKPEESCGSSIAQPEKTINGKKEGIELVGEEGSRCSRMCLMM